MKPDRNSKKNSEMNLADLSGEELVRRWKDGNERAAEILADRYSLRLVALVASKLNQRFRGVTDPEDIVQSALGSFFNAAASVKPSKLCRPTSEIVLNHGWTRIDTDCLLSFIRVHWFLSVVTDTESTRKSGRLFESLGESYGCAV